MKPAKPQHPVSAFADAETPQKPASDTMHAVLCGLLGPESLISGAQSLLTNHPALAADRAVLAALGTLSTALEQVREATRTLDCARVAATPEGKFDAFTALDVMLKTKTTLDFATNQLRECEIGVERGNEAAIYADELLCAALGELGRLHDIGRAALKSITSAPDAQSVIAPILERAKLTPRAATVGGSSAADFASHVCIRAGTLQAMAHAAGALLALGEFSATNPQLSHAEQVLVEIAAQAKQLSGEALDAAQGSAGGAA
jgi:hypothetical protein